MSRGLQRHKITIPLAHGLETRTDERALEAPSLLVADNIEFDEWGGVQPRKAFAQITDAGSSIQEFRRLATYGDQLVAFTKTGLWTYSEGDGAWTERGAYLAPKVDETSRFTTNAEQFDCDRAEAGGVTFFSWTEDVRGTESIKIAMIETATGSVLAVNTIGAFNRPRLLALDNHVVFTYWNSASNLLYVRVYDPSDLTYDSDTQTRSGQVAYDIAKVDATNFVIATAETTQIALQLYDSTATRASVTTRTVTADGVIGVAVQGTTGDIMAVFDSSGTIRSDRFNSTPTFQEENTYTPSGSTVERITCVWGDAAESGQYRAYSIWSMDESDTGAWNVSQWAYHDDGGTSNAAQHLCTRVGVASKAFLYDSRPFVWLVYAAVPEMGATTTRTGLDNVYVLYRVTSDARSELVSKAAAGVAGGFHANQGHTAHVQASTTSDVETRYHYKWCGQERRKFLLGSEHDSGYAARSPLEISTTLDSDEARRTVQLGGTLYIAGGQLSQFDGRDVVEVGFHVNPTKLTVSSASSAGTNLDGTYTYRSTFGFQNAAGEHERSTTAATYTIEPSEQEGQLVVYPLTVTRKTGASKPAIEYWRTPADPVFDTPSHLVTSVDPSLGQVDNTYIQNQHDADSTTYDDWSAASGHFRDDYDDDTLRQQEMWPESRGLLEAVGPPSCSIIHADQSRIYIAGIAGHPHRLAYSMLREDGEVAHFSPGLYVDMPALGGPITAVQHLNETLIVFKEKAIYALPGEGFDNTGGGYNFGPPRLLSSDVGCDAGDAVAYTPKGLVFHSKKGWYVLNHGWATTYIGSPTYDRDQTSGTVWTSALVHEKQHQVRFTTQNPGFIFAWDYQRDQWSRWGDGQSEVHPAYDSVIHNGEQYVIQGGNNDIVVSQATDFSAGGPGNVVIETSWLRMEDIQGMQRTRWAYILGEYRADCEIRVRIAYDYNDTWVDDKTMEFTSSDYSVGDPIQFRHGIQRQKHQSLKFELTIRDTDATVLSTAGAKLTALTLEMAAKRGAYKHLAAANRQ